MLVGKIITSTAVCVQYEMEVNEQVIKYISKEMCINVSITDITQMLASKMFSPIIYYSSLEYKCDWSR